MTHYKNNKNLQNGTKKLHKLKKEDEKEEEGEQRDIYLPDFKINFKPVNI